VDETLVSEEGEPLGTGRSLDVRDPQIKADCGALASLMDSSRLQTQVRCCSLLPTLLAVSPGAGRCRTETGVMAAVRALHSRFREHYACMRSKAPTWRSSSIERRSAC
jgi:hypothetical protein